MKQTPHIKPPHGKPYAPRNCLLRPFAPLAFAVEP
jgi:hypothetical protein